MNKNKYEVLGVMSGTSLDGVDIAHIRFEKTHKWSFDILKSETIPYDSQWKSDLKNAINQENKELETLNKKYTNYLGGIISKFIKNHHIESLDLVASHGHTILHQPQNGLTLQIGNLPHIASFLRETVVCDFRVQDVALGGQGAPLVPIGDQLLFKEYEYCLNLGGFANISTENKGERLAFDICPVNIVLNHYVQMLEKEYDDGGKLASTGEINEQLLEALNDLSFYKMSAPKSLGFEWVKKEIFPLIDQFQLPIKDVLRTFVEHVAFQLGVQIKNTTTKVLITGGGAYHDFLINRLKKYTSATIIIPSNQIVEFKEALVFGFLGVLKIRNEINVLASVTGASKNHSSGKIFHY